jgi:hypothetical protein
MKMGINYINSTYSSEMIKEVNLLELGYHVSTMEPKVPLLNTYCPHNFWYRTHGICKNTSIVSLCLIHGTRNWNVLNTSEH